MVRHFKYKVEISVFFLFCFFLEKPWFFTLIRPYLLEYSMKTHQARSQYYFREHKQNWKIYKLKKKKIEFYRTIFFLSLHKCANFVKTFFSNIGFPTV